MIRDPSNLTERDKMQIFKIIGKYIRAPIVAVRGISRRMAAKNCITPTTVY